MATSNNNIRYCKMKLIVFLMRFCETSDNWSQRKSFFYARKLNFLISVKEAYERKLASITASISKLEEQINSSSTSVENQTNSFPLAQLHPLGFFLAQI